MQPVELLVICVVAFLMVFVILALLAFMMRLIILLFPEKRPASDAAMVAAIAAAVETVFPGTKITNVEELK